MSECNYECHDCDSACPRNPDESKRPKTCSEVESLRAQLAEKEQRIIRLLAEIAASCDGCEQKAKTAEARGEGK